MLNHVYINFDGWFHAVSLYKKMVEAAPDEGAHFVEVGSWQGQSTAYMAVEIANSGKAIRFDAVDHFNGDAETAAFMPRRRPLLEIFIDNLHRHALFEYVRPIVAESTRAALLYDDCSLDFVYLDASHDYESVKADIMAWWPKIKVGGILAGDDFSEYHKGLRRAVKEFGVEYAIDGVNWIVRKQ